MVVEHKDAALMVYLKTKSALYYGKVHELRNEVRNWLAYIPQTFPHYTRHTIEHSDAIILQLSKLLFWDDNPTKPVVQLSGVEAYILIAAAYLHDAGMVTSDREKQEIIQSDAWREWTTGDGGGAKRWNDIEELRNSRDPSNESVKHFICDLQTRFLIAEYVRRTDFRRAAVVIEEHQQSMGRFAFDSFELQQTIADVCVAHGLERHQLEDNEQYPEQRDILGEKVNVRFLAILLRLGDLLEMSHDRACPLLLNVACPLPADSLAHWSQYRRIRHRLTSPERIEIRAECESQDEHRVLQDWCQWIVDELRFAAAIMARATRHAEWRPPMAGINDGTNTIVIRPSSKASYIWSAWKFELDHQAVFERLIHDAYESPVIFIRELVQNALDATRCQMYTDLVAESIEPPASPTQVEEERRSRYPVKVSLREEKITNQLSGEDELRQVFRIEDCGIGMDHEIIERYFLQVGRSYYTTEQFRREFPFMPSSRFGIGFLSVFSVSDHVTVETYKPTSTSDGKPIRLTLTGPRNYLLTDVGERSNSGTRIDVWLREPMEAGKLTSILRSWCPKVEFPIEVTDLGEVSTIEAERPDQFIYETQDVTENEARLVAKCFPINRSGLEGEIYVFARITKRGESWADLNWALHSYPKLHPQAMSPEFPNKLICENGITIFEERGYISGPLSYRVDYRGRQRQLTLSKVLRLHSIIWDPWEDPVIQSRCEELLLEHLSTSPFASGDRAWIYKQKLIKLFPYTIFWGGIPDTIRILKNGQPQFVSLKDIKSNEILTTVIGIEFDRIVPSALQHKQTRTKKTPVWDNIEIILIAEDIEVLSDEHRSTIFENRFIDQVRWLKSGHLAIDWKQCDREDVLFHDGPTGPIGIASLPDDNLIGARIHKTTDNNYEYNLLNQNHKFVRWLVRVKDACEAEEYGFDQHRLGTLIALISHPVQFGGHRLTELNAYLQIWSQVPGLPMELKPPSVNLELQEFVWQNPDLKPE